MAFAGGNGTVANPYQIATAAHLNDVRNYLSSHFIMLNNIDLSTATRIDGTYWNGSAGWNPFGTDTDGFKGTFNGNGFSIIGMYIKRNIYALGGFCKFLDYTGVIKNLNMVSIEIVKTSGNRTGSLVGSNRGLIYRCSASGSITATTGAYIGGLVGYNENYTSSIIRESFSKVNVITAADSSYIGGLVGTNASIIEDCYCSGTVNGKRYVGGFSGSMGWGSMIYRSYTISPVTKTHATNFGGFNGGEGAHPCFYCGFDVQATGFTQTGLIGTMRWPYTSMEYPTGLSTALAKSFSTYSAHWNIALLENFTNQIWKMCEGTYPILGWDNINVPSHTVTYLVDSKTYDQDIITCGSKLTPPPPPVKKRFGFIDDPNT